MFLGKLLSLLLSSILTQNLRILIHVNHLRNVLMEKHLKF